MEVEPTVESSLQHILKNRLAKNELRQKFKTNRQEYNRDRRIFLANANHSGIQQQQYPAFKRPDIILLITATIREEHQRLVKQYKNSLAARESNQKIRLKQEELEQRIRELPLQIKALEDLRELWRALQNYVADLKLTNRMAYMFEEQNRNILQTIFEIVKLDQPHIDLFIQCFSKDCLPKWNELLGSPFKWSLFFTK
ncbi:hypothetical protein M3Y97_00763400 [Aphelenchoides bicaudatus]|nr:hypothetical protein M3Y97_00763400 [Aphelenchoides bicaudatus]